MNKDDILTLVAWGDGSYSLLVLVVMNIFEYKFPAVLHILLPPYYIHTVGGGILTRWEGFIPGRFGGQAFSRDLNRVFLKGAVYSLGGGIYTNNGFFLTGYC